MSARGRRGAGWVRERSDGSWVLVRSVTVNEAGRKVRRRRTIAVFATQAEAEQAARILPHDPAAFLTVNSWSATWLRRVAGKGLAPATVDGYRHAIGRVLPHIGDRPLDSLEVGDMVDLWQDLGERYSRRTVAATRQALGLCLTAAVVDRKLDRNVARLSELPRRALDADSDEGAVRWLDDAKLAMLVDELTEGSLASHRLALPLLVIAHTGIRRGECLGIRCGDLDLDVERPRVHLRKQAKVVDGRPVLGPLKSAASQRTVHLDRHAADMLRDRAKAASARRSSAAGLLFTSVSGGVQRPDSLTHWCLDHVGPRIGVDRFGPHMLRHTWAMRAREQGHPSTVIAGHLGHADVSVVERWYFHPFVPEDGVVLDSPARGSA